MSSLPGLGRISQTLAGGKLFDLVDIAFVAEVDDMQKIEDIHMILVHMIMQSVHEALHETS